MGDAAYWPAPAKLNLMLRVVGRRDDGYHLLQTVFQFLEIHDRLAYRLRDDGEIRRLRELAGTDPDQDLTLRAARLLREHCGTRRGVEIDLDKRLPMGGGLGGGSSDAATTLVALNRLWGCGLDRDELARLGLRLGADVPVFVYGHAAWGEGVGEHLQAIVLPESWYLLLFPGCHVSTAEIFRHPELTRNSTPVKISDFFSGDERNDCEPLVRRLYPRVDAAMAGLGQIARARLTGTGATVFAAFDTREAAHGALHEMPAEYHGVVTRGVNRSPLFDRNR